MPPAETLTPPNTKAPQSNDPARRTIINQQCKLLIAVDNNRHKKMFHVEDFVGLYPSWPIIELAISPLGNTKDNRIHHS